MTGIILASVLAVYALMTWGFALGVLRLRGISGKRSDPQAPAMISVVIPVRNEASHLPALLDALNNQTASAASFEVIVVDDWSEDETLAIADSVKKNYSCRMISMQKEGSPPGKKNALAAGIAAARFPVILVTDGDCIPTAGWIASFSRIFSDPHCQLVAGMVRYHTPCNGFAMVETLDFYGLVGSAAGAAGLGHPFMCNAANMAFRKEAYDAIDGAAPHIHLSSGDDVFLLHQIKKRFGSSAIVWNFDDEGEILTEGSSSLKAFFQQRIRWASKGKAYKDTTAIAVALVVLLTNFALVAGVVAGMVVHDITMPLILFCLKALADFPLSSLIARKFKQSSLLWYFIPATIVYPFYTGMIGVMAMFHRPTWKGRRVR
jgi:poly-beta-1,6-N-acetyl-D-glucosamine synthase